MNSWVSCVRKGELKSDQLYAKDLGVYDLGFSSYS
jgi:hypothetical protein